MTNCNPDSSVDAANKAESISETKIQEPGHKPMFFGLDAPTGVIQVLNCP